MPDAAETHRVTLKTRVWALLDIILRVPPVFVMDAILNNSLGLGRDHHHEKATVIDERTFAETAKAGNNNTTSTFEDDVFDIGTLDGTSLGWFLLYSQAFVLAFLVFLLSTKQLLSVYLWLASVGDILWSYIWNEQYIKYSIHLVEKQSSVVYEIITLNRRALTQFGGNYTLQVFLAIIFCFSNSAPQNFVSKRVVGLSFIGPTVLSLLPLPVSLLLIAPIVSSAIAFWYIIFALIGQGKNIYRTVHNGVMWCRNMIRHFGLYTLIENQWIRLHIPQVLRVFWLTRVTEQAVFMIANATHENYHTNGIISVTLDSMFAMGKDLLIRGCETVVAVLGMTSVISSISHYIGYVMQNFLLTEDPEDRSIGFVSATLFFVLALQTGLTGMEPEKRFLRLYRNLCLLFTAIFHFIHSMVNPLLLSLSASRNTSLNKHGRALLVCAFLVVFPSWFLHCLWARHSVSTWLLAVSAFSIEVIIKVIISLLVYGLFMADAYRNTFWEKLDDYVYYIRATGSTIEFIFGIFLFFNGAWILFFESGGTIRACMMCIHAYFNIWLQAKMGWKVFMKRRSAVNKINLLPEATEEQLERFDDVCAICYQELNNARITRCGHYFHGVCLRKWLYVQDICPLCHKTLYTVDNDNNDSNTLFHYHED